MNCTPDKLAFNLSLIQQALRDLRCEVPDECQTSYLDAISQLARIEGFVKGQDDAYLRSTFQPKCQPQPRTGSSRELRTT